MRRTWIFLCVVLSILILVLLLTVRRQYRPAPGPDPTSANGRNQLCLSNDTILKYEVFRMRCPHEYELFFEALRLCPLRLETIVHEIKRTCARLPDVELRTNIEVFSGNELFRMIGDGKMTLERDIWKTKCETHKTHFYELIANLFGDILLCVGNDLPLYVTDEACGEKLHVSGNWTTNNQTHCVNFPKPDSRDKYVLTQANGTIVESEEQWELVTGTTDAIRKTA